jgi:hypothetical protein
MRKLIIAVAALALVGGLALGLFALVGAITRPAETYAEQQARLAREQQSADFWQWVIRVVLVLICVVVLGTVALIWSNYSHRRKMELLRFHEDRMRLKPDQNGNYDARFDRYGEVIKVRPGNKAFAEPPVFVNGAMPTQLQAPGRNGSSGQRGMTVRRNQEPIAYYVNEVTPPELEAPMPARTVNLPSDLPVSEPDLPNLQAEISRKFTDVLPEIETAIREGRGKTDTLKALGLGGRYYKEAGTLWDEVEARLKK